MAQSPSQEQTNPLVGKSDVDQKGAPNQQTDAQQRPDVSGAKGADAPGKSGEGATAALATAQESADKLGEKAPDGSKIERSTAETK